ncbi:histamine N-methyltransferase-like [Amphiura filiformis]|uniref:histamine N-methyltransferase-like n=1 Tax=Amphiura filiformis TaxID=82378 RepID=UPI003B220A5E
MYGRRGGGRRRHLEKRRLYRWGRGEAYVRGYQELVQMRILKSEFPQISATVLEPSTKQITKYQDTVAKSCDLGGVDYDWQNQTFQEYMRSTGAKEKYHFITIVDAIYFLGEAEEAVRKLYELLEPGGMMFILLQTEHTGVGKLMEAFPHLAAEDNNSRTSESVKVNTNRLTSSKEVKNALDKFQINYTQYSSLEYLDLTSCFTQALTPVSSLLLDLATGTKNFSKSVPDEVFNQVMDFLRLNMRVVKSDEDDDKFYLDTENDVFLIAK